jgi:hypothetical protein
MKTLTTLLTLLVAIGAGAQGKYTTFGLGEGAYNAVIYTINDSGQVLGRGPENGNAYVISPSDVWTRNIVKTNGSLLSMNNAATIVGEEAPDNRPFYKVWGQPAMQIYNCGNGTAVNPINAAGYVAGNCAINAHRGQFGVFWANPPQDTFTIIPFPHDAYPNDWSHVQAASLNDLNQIVGSWENYSTPWSGFFYDSQSKKLNTTFNMPGAVSTYPAAVNDNQEVVGDWLDANNVYHGFYWNPTAGFSDIDVAGDTEMILVGINNSSVILGRWTDDNTPKLNHWVTIVGGHPTASINVPKSQPGSTIAAAINNVGQATGTYTTQEGVVRGYVYTPPK